METREEWIQKMWFICIMLFKKEDIMNVVGKRMEPENIILSEVTQTQKDMHMYYKKMAISQKSTE